jgi:hypothetical protein
VVPFKGSHDFLPSLFTSGRFRHFACLIIRCRRDGPTSDALVLCLYKGQWLYSPPIVRPGIAFNLWGGKHAGTRGIHTKTRLLTHNNTVIYIYIYIYIQWNQKQYYITQPGFKFLQLTSHDTLNLSGTNQHLVFLPLIAIEPKEFLVSNQWSKCYVLSLITEPSSFILLITW